MSSQNHAVSLLPIARLLLAFALALTVLGGLPSAAQAAASAVDGFDPDADSAVYALVVQPDGKIVLGGWFTTLNGGTETRHYIARLNTDGSLDATFHPNVDSGMFNAVYTLALQADGKIVMGGKFTTLNGGTETRHYIARLHPDGSLDATFNPDANNTVNALVVQPDGKIVIGGIFTRLNGGTVTRNRIARLNADGSVDTTFNPNADNYVSALALQADGKIVLGGSFTTLNGVKRNRIARLNADGSVDTTTFNANADNEVSALALQADGKVVMGGYFTTLNGVTRNRIARLSSDSAAQQTLAANGTGSAILWQRSGAGSELTHVTFEQSTDFVNWTSLGAASRVGTTASWQLTGLTLPTGQNLWLRARGSVSSDGYPGSSQSLIDAVRLVYLSGTPTAATLTAFEALHAPGSLQVSWQTAPEPALLGFRLYRAEAAGGPRELLTPALLPAQAGGEYTYDDLTALPNRPFHYWLELVFADGATQAVGPLSAARYTTYLPALRAP